MNRIPPIIDNQKKKLIDVLSECCKYFDELSIATGYWDLGGTQLLLPEINKFKKVRLLIGQELLIPRYKVDQIEVDFPDKDIFEDLEKLEYLPGNRKIINNIFQLIEKNILEVKVFKRDFLHAKCYIYGNFRSEKAIGIIGSSNFTKNGLTKNYELNTGEDDYRLIQYQPQTDQQEHGHLSWFEKVWNDNKNVEWSKEFIELLNTSNHGNLLFSPYMMYIKILSILFKDVLNKNDELTNINSIDLFDFQKRNVKQLLIRMERNGVAMLADSVGLGKTISAIGVCKQYKDKRIVVIAPKSLVKHWEKELIKKEVPYVKVISMQNIENIKNENSLDKFMPVGLFIIDESHNLRNIGRKRYEVIQQWIANNKNAKTLLLTATPVNNTISDIINQILLGTRGNVNIFRVNIRDENGLIVSLPFNEALKRIQKMLDKCRSKNENYEIVKKEARVMIDPILREFIIRNSRYSIEQELQGKRLIVNNKAFKFPEINVNNSQYDLSTNISTKQNNQYQEILNCPIEILKDAINTFQHPIKTISEFRNSKELTGKSQLYILYQFILSLSFIPYRYNIYQNNLYGKNIANIKDKDLVRNINLQIGRYGLLRIIFLKRLDSSIYSLLKSLKNYKDKLNKFEKNLKLNKIIDNDEDILENYNYYGDYLNVDVGIRNIVESEININNYNLKELFEDIKIEQSILDHIIEIVNKLLFKDGKINELLILIDRIINKSNKSKVLVFSYFADTIKYLEEQLIKKSTIINSDNSMFVSGKIKTLNEIADRFSPVSRDVNETVEKKGTIQFLFSTDVLSEGQNLQDCGNIINYDLHWNPVRMIQRNGRINRLGTTHSIINIYNLVPNDELEQYLGLIENLQRKIDTISISIGNDTSILGEDISSVSYKGIYNKNKAIASKVYLELENSVELFADDIYYYDLINFYNCSDKKDIDLLNRIPVKKWGILDINNKNKNCPMIIVFSKITLSNNRERFVFFKKEDLNDQLDIMLETEALEFIKSEHKDNIRDTLSFSKTEQYSEIKDYGDSLLSYDKQNQTLTKSQINLLEIMYDNGYSDEKISKVRKLLTSENIIEKKHARKTITNINKLYKTKLNLNTIYELEKIISRAEKLHEELISVIKIEPLYGFYKVSK